MVGSSEGETDANREGGAVHDPSRPVDRSQEKFYCPVCESRPAEFKDFNGRKQARCSRCGSLERHRSVWVYFKQRTDLFKDGNRTFLHFAPEACLADRFSSFFKSGYLTSDLNMQGAMIKMDIMHIPCPDNSFEIIYSSHVLEHVEDFVQALQELYRVLVASRWMMLLIPDRTEKKTFRFAQTSPGGHIWKFGSDFIEIMEKIGFNVQSWTVAELFTQSQIRSMRLKKRQEIFHCFK